MGQGRVISAVIPTLNAARGLGASLRSLDGDLVTEIIVVDAGSTDDTAQIAAGAGARVLGPVAPNRGVQLATGCAEAQGAWLLVLHADTQLESGWTRAARRHIAEGPGTAGWFRFRLDDPAGIARVWEQGVNLRSRLLGLPYGDQGLLISRPLYEAVGGYRPLPLMEDVDLARRLGRFRLSPLAARAVTSAARYRRDGYLRRSVRNSLLLARWLAGADPADLARRYG